MKSVKAVARRSGLACLAAVLALALTGCGEKSPLDPKDPVSLTVWHYYNGSQQAAFDALVEEFNDTVGQELGIYVEGYSQGSVSDLESAVRDAIGGKVGADAMPDIFSSYADTAYEMEQSGALADLSGGGRGIGNQVEALLINPLARWLFDHAVLTDAEVTIEAFRLDERPPAISCTAKEDAPHA